MMNKQIEEMAQIIAKNVYGIEQDAAYAPNARNASKELFSKGYRRQEDVARDIFERIKEKARGTFLLTDPPKVLYEILEQDLIKIIQEVQEE